jgi:hypothetical protein
VLWAATSAGYGGAVLGTVNSHVEFNNTSFKGNKATFGGGLILVNNATGRHGGPAASKCGEGCHASYPCTSVHD